MMAVRPIPRALSPRSRAWRVLDRAERPVAIQPRADGVVEHRVERRLVRAHPGVDDRIPPGGDEALSLLTARRVDVDAADDLAGGGAEHRVGEPAPFGEVTRVALEVAQVLRGAHLVRPVPSGESGRRPDVVDARGPGGVVRVVVLRAERLQPELRGREPAGHREIGRDEQLIIHQGDGSRPGVGRSRRGRGPPSSTASWNWRTSWEPRSSRRYQWPTW